MKVLAIVQARMGSTRLPNKVMREVDGIPLIELLLARLSHSIEIDQIVLATSIDSRNIPLVNHVTSLGYQSFQGSEDNVLERFYLAAQQFSGDIINQKKNAITYSIAGSVILFILTKFILTKFILTFFILTFFINVRPYEGIYFHMFLYSLW